MICNMFYNFKWKQSRKVFNFVIESQWQLTKNKYDY